MRVVGLFSRDRAAIERFAERWRDPERNHSGPVTRLRCRPTEVPLVAIATVEGSNPPVQWAETPDGSFAVLDGEVFGRVDLPLVGLEGGRDAASLLALYAAKGPAGISDMNGGAFLVIFDAARRSLLLFRDRFGQVPIFYSERPEGLYWASDMPTLLQIGIPRTLDLNALDFFMAAGYVPAPWTVVEQIRKVPPAQYFRTSAAGVGETGFYWKGTGQPKLALSAEEAAARLGELVERGVRRRNTAAGRLGVLLSGGVDSALLVGCLASRIEAEVEAFTFRYGAYEGPLNEDDPARETAAHFGVPHHVLDYGPADVSENIERMARGYGEPFIWGIHTYNLHRLAEAGISAVFSGAGADSWTIRRRENWVMRLRALPAPARVLAAAPMPLLRMLCPAFGRSMGVFLQCVRTGIPFSALSPVMSETYRRRIYRDPTMLDRGRQAAAELLGKMRQDFAGEDDRDRFLLLRQRLFFSECNLFWNHAWSRANNLAMRHPYNDNDLQDFAMRLPHVTTDKEELRRYAASILPPQKAFAPKVFHRIPLESWFRGPLTGFLREQLSADRLRRHGVFDAVAIGQLIDEHIAGRASHTSQLLAVLTVTVWLDVVLKGVQTVRA